MADVDIGRDVGFCDITKEFVLLGWTAFGGPAAHVAQFKKVFVDSVHWMTEGMFVELFALCQCLPGPSSTQMSFAIGTTKKAILGGLLSGILFQYPGALMMTALGLSADDWLTETVLQDNKWLHGTVNGLNAAGVALVMSAAIGLGNKACGEGHTKFYALATAVVTHFIFTFWLAPFLIIICGVINLMYLRCTRREKEAPLVTSKDAEGLELQPRDEKPVAQLDDLVGVSSFGVGRGVGAVLICLWLGILFAGTFATERFAYEDMKWLFWFMAFYRSGAIIWGGGQVLLPLIANEVVYGTGWIEEQTFQGGLALAQAMPGPLFNFAAFLGAAIGKNEMGDVLGQTAAGVFGAAICWLGLFLPGILLIFGVLPFWASFRDNQLYKDMLPGLNASAVGLVFAASIDLALKMRSPEVTFAPKAVTGICMIAFWFSHFLELPVLCSGWLPLPKFQAPLTVILGGILGLGAGVLNLADPI